jgi:hypothetical protein
MQLQAMQRMHYCTLMIIMKVMSECEFLHAGRIQRLMGLGARTHWHTGWRTRTKIAPAISHSQSVRRYVRCLSTL